MDYTGQGPGKYAPEYEVEVLREYLLYKDNNDKWQISVEYITPAALTSSET